MRLITQQLIIDRSSPLVIRSRLRAVSKRMGFHNIQMERIQIAASELMTNQMKFATGAGLFQVWEHFSPAPSLDLFAFDHGPGIQDIQSALTDGYSTANTLGRGLGSIARAADCFDIYSKEGSPHSRSWCGTAAWARFHLPAPPSHPPIEGLLTGRFLRALRDNVFNGDTIRTASSPSFFNWIHLDGLGHGREAAMTSESLHELPKPETDPESLLTTLHHRLNGSRGAMGLAVRLNFQNMCVDYAGLGDLALRILGSEKKSMPCFPGGVLGRGGGHPGKGSFDLEPDMLICSSSDGILIHPDISEFPGLKNRHPQLIALLMGNLLGRDHDDKSLFIAQYKNGIQTRPPRSIP